MSDKDFSIAIKEKAIEIGFSACGISDAEPFSAEKEPIISKWLAQNQHAGLNYLERNLDKRLQPKLLFEGTQSIIVVLLNYHNPNYFLHKKSDYIFSQYAVGMDYHKVVKDKLRLLTDFVTTKYPQSKNRSFVDSAPVLEKHLAYKAGLGTIGKNSLLLSPKGSYFFIGEIFTDIPLAYDSPLQEDYCLACNRCIEACPTQALAKDYCLDAGKCIAYQTIEDKFAIAEDVADKMGNHVYGCDICQQACPKNRQAEPTNVKEFAIKKEFLQWKNHAWENLNETAFQSSFHDSAVYRIGLSKLKQNIETVKHL